MARSSIRVRRPIRSNSLFNGMINAHQNTRPGLAIIANGLPPYRVHLHTEVATRIPELKLHTLITHGAAEFEWQVSPPASIHASFFGSPGDSPLAPTFHRPRMEWQKGKRIIEYLREHDIRAVICNGYRYISYLRIIAHCHRKEIPLFVRNDSNIRGEIYLPAWKKVAKPRLYAWWLARSSGVMSMGEYGDQFFLKYGADPTRLYRVPCLPDCDSFSRAVPDRLEGFRRKYQLRSDRHYLLYSGRLVPQKRVDLLVDAFDVLADERPDWDLLVVGDGVLGDSLRERVPERLRSRVIWAGFQELDDCISAYHAADVLVLPSDREPWAVVVQEAMAAGLAVVASDAVGAARDLITDGISGRIFPMGDGAELQRAIRDVTDPSALAAYREQSRAALDEWRRRADPVAEIRRALVEHGILNRK
jgi:glycosyltransferase involved in cell wall biosynthesis